MTAAHAILLILAIDLTAGALFAVAFVTVGVGRLDPAARGASFGFRLLILPGVAALWPVMLAKWIDARRRSA